MWCGQQDLLGLSDGVTVYVAARGDHSAVIVLDGDPTEPATRALMDVVWREAQRPKCRVVYLMLITLRGEIDRLSFYCNTTLGLLPERVATVAYLATCCGAGLYLASRCHLVFASPTAIIGHAECWSPAGELDAARTTKMGTELAHHLPETTASTWWKLIGCSVNGEAAEALGIAACRRSFWELCSLREGEGVAAC